MAQTGKIKVITMDIMGTLIRFRQPIESVFLSALRTALHSHTHASPLPRHRHPNQLHHQVHHNHHHFQPPVIMDAVQSMHIRDSFLAEYHKMKRDVPCYGYTHMSSKDWWKIIVDRVIDSSQDINVAIRTLAQFNIERESMKLKDQNSVDDVSSSITSTNSLSTIIDSSEEIESLRNLIFQKFYSALGSQRTYAAFFDDFLFLRWARKKQALKLGILSNGNERHQDGLLPLFGLEEEFDFYVFAKEVGVEKPHPLIFNHALEVIQQHVDFKTPPVCWASSLLLCELPKTNSNENSAVASSTPSLFSSSGSSGSFPTSSQHVNDNTGIGSVRTTGISPGDVLHVGSDPELDCEPAFGLGMKAVLMDRKGEHSQTRWVKNGGYVVNNFAELKKLILDQHWVTDESVDEKEQRPHHEQQVHRYVHHHHHHHHQMPNDDGDHAHERDILNRALKAGATSHRNRAPYHYVFYDDRQ